MGPAAKRGQAGERSQARLKKNVFSLPNSLFIFIFTSLVHRNEKHNPMEAIHMLKPSNTKRVKVANVQGSPKGDPPHTSNHCHRVKSISNSNPRGHQTSPNKERSVPISQLSSLPLLPFAVVLALTDHRNISIVQPTHAPYHSPLSPAVPPHAQKTKLSCPPLPNYGVITTSRPVQPTHSRSMLLVSYPIN